MTFPHDKREVTVFRGKGKNTCPIGKVVVDINDPDCFNWKKITQNKLSVFVTNGARGATNTSGGW